MKHFALIYDLVEHFVERRKPLSRGASPHLHDAQARGLIVMAGPLGDPPDGALLVFRADSSAAVEAWVRADPYVTNGIVVGWRVRPWNLVIGVEPAC